MIIYNDKTIVIPLGINPNYSIYTPQGELQQKTVDSSTQLQEVGADYGYVGLYKVKVNPYTLDSSSLVIDKNGEYSVTSTADGLSRVDVSVNIDVQTYYDEGYAAGEVDGIAEQKAKLDSSTFHGNGTFSREDGWNEITVDVTEVNNQNKTVDSSTAAQSITADAGYTGLGTVTVNPYELDTKSVAYTENGTYSVASSADGLSRVDVSVNIDTQSYYNSGYSDGETAGIAEGIAEQKAKLDSSTFTSVGTFTREDGWNEITVDVNTVNNQDKTIDSSTVSQTVTPDSEHTGLGSVTVNPYVLDSKTVDPSTNSQTVTSSEDGLSSVTVNGVTSSIDSNIAAGNIKQGVTILGVEGTLVGGTLQSKTIDSSIVNQTVYPDAGNYGLSDVTVNPYKVQTRTTPVSWNYEVVELDTSAGSYNLTPQGTYDALEKVIINKVPILKEITVNPSTSTVIWDARYDASTVVGLQKFAVTQVTSSIDSNIQAGNIKKDVTILGVTGTYEAETINNQSKTVDSSTASQEITFDSGYTGLSTVTVNPYTLDSSTVDPSTNSQTVTSTADGLSSVTVNAVTSAIDSNITAGNIKKDVVILGVTGTYDGGTSEAVPVEYISNEDDLNLVFNSGYTPNDTTKIIARIAWGGEGLGSWGNYFGVQNNFALREWGGYGSQSGEITWQTIGGSCAVQGVYTTPGDITIIRDIEVGNNYVIADSSSGSTGTYSGTVSNKPMFIFGASDPDSGTLTELSSREMRIHSFAIYEGTTLVKNFIPYQDASSNGCFYESVSDTFIYPLQGTPKVGPVAIYQQKTVDASLNAVEVTADAGFEALSKVTVNGVTSAVDPNITPGNIKAGVSILGVGGSFAGAIYHRVGYVCNGDTNKKIFRNTGILPTNNTRIVATVSFDDIPTGESGYGYLWGVSSNTGAAFTVREFGGYGAKTVSFIDPDRGYYSCEMSSAPRTYSCGQIENDYAFMSYGGYIDERGTWSHTWQTGDEIFIWAGNKGNDTVDEYATRVMRLYDFKIYEGDTLVFHGVPAADNDGAYVLIDLVSNTMVEGEGTLTGGGVYVEPDENDYVENGQYATDSSIGDVYFNLGSQLNMYDISDSTNVKAYIEVVASVPPKSANGGTITTSAILGNLTSSSTGNYFLIGNVSKTQAQFALQQRTLYASGIAPGMNTYTMMAYKNNNATYNGGRLCVYINNVPANVYSLSLSNASTGSDVYVFKANGNANWDCVRGTRIYQIKYYKPSDGLVHILVPAYNNGQYCFKDVIDNTYLYAAAGTPTGHVSGHYLTNNGAIDIYTA